LDGIGTDAEGTSSEDTPPGEDPIALADGAVTPEERAEGTADSLIVLDGTLEDAGSPPVDERATAEERPDGRVAPPLRDFDGLALALFTVDAETRAWDEAAGESVDAEAPGSVDTAVMLVDGPPFEEGALEPRVFDTAGSEDGFELADEDFGPAEGLGVGFVAARREEITTAVLDGRADDTAEALSTADTDCISSDCDSALDVEAEGPTMLEIAVVPNEALCDGWIASEEVGRMAFEEGTAEAVLDGAPDAGSPLAGGLTTPEEKSDGRVAPMLRDFEGLVLALFTVAAETPTWDEATGGSIDAEAPGSVETAVGLVDGPSSEDGALEPGVFDTAGSEDGFKPAEEGFGTAEGLGVGFIDSAGREETTTAVLDGRAADTAEALSTADTDCISSDCDSALDVEAEGPTMLEIAVVPNEALCDGWLAAEEVR
jgi:hypothetical protein